MSNEFINASTTSAKAGSKVYGQWNYERELSSIDAMIEFRPFDAKKGEVTAAWGNVFKRVNKTNPELRKLSDNAIKNKINKLIDNVKEKQKNDLVFGTGSNDSETLLENRVLELISLVVNNYICILFNTNLS